MPLVVYTLTFPDGRQYVGCSTNPESRRCTHFRRMRQGRHDNRLVQQAFSSAGTPQFDIVACGTDRATLHEVEAAVIEALRPALNIAPATPVPATKDLQCREFGPYPSIAEAARDLGVTYHSLKKLAGRFSYEAVLYRLAYRKPSRPPRQRKPPSDYGKILVGGVLDYPKNHCARLGISRNRYLLATRNGVDPFSLGAPMPQPPRMISAGGRTQTLAAWARESGLKGVTICARLDRQGWTPEEAVGLVTRELPPTHGKNNQRTITAGGVTRPIREWAKLAGLGSPTAINSRLALGWTVEQAVGLVPRSRS